MIEKNDLINSPSEIDEHFKNHHSEKMSSSLEKLEKLKQAIIDIGFQIEETEEGIRIS
jgi:type III secretory pathway lipoprotein EscJ